MFECCRLPPRLKGSPTAIAKSASSAVGADPVVPVLMGVALAAITLVAACVISVVFGPDPETLRPIDKQAGHSSADPESAAGRPACGDRPANPTATEDGGAAESEAGPAPESASRGPQTRFATVQSVHRF
jgi:hypothetical protein